MRTRERERGRNLDAENKTSASLRSHHRCPFVFVCVRCVHEKNRFNRMQWPPLLAVPVDGIVLCMRQCDTQDTAIQNKWVFYALTPIQPSGSGSYPNCNDKRGHNSIQPVSVPSTRYTHTHQLDAYFNLNIFQVVAVWGGAREITSRRMHVEVFFVPTSEYIFYGIGYRLPCVMRFFSLAFASATLRIIQFQFGIGVCRVCACACGNGGDRDPFVSCPCDE